MGYKKKNESFTEAHIFRSATRLFSVSELKIRNMSQTAQRTVGDMILRNIGKCIEYAKIGWETPKNKVKLKLTYMVLAKRELDKTEALLGLLIDSGVIPVKNKVNMTRDVLIKGGAEMSYALGNFENEINTLIKSFEEKIDNLQLEEIYDKLPLY